MKKYENNSQGQRSRSNVTNFRPLLAFIMGHISTKLRQFLISSFRDFVQIDRQTDAAKDNTCSQHSWCAGVVQDPVDNWFLLSVRAQSNAWKNSSSKWLVTWVGRQTLIAHGRHQNISAAHSFTRRFYLPATNADSIAAAWHASK